MTGEDKEKKPKTTDTFIQNLRGMGVFIRPIGGNGPLGGEKKK